MHIHHTKREKMFILLLVDLLAIGIAYAIALLVGHKKGLPINLYWHYRWGLTVSAFFIIAFFVILDCYSLKDQINRFLRQSLRLGLALILSSVAATFSFFFFRGILIPRAVFILFFFFSFILIILFRYMATKFIKPISRQVLIVGNKKNSQELAEFLQNNNYLNYHLLGYVSDDRDADSSNVLSYLGKTINLPQVVEKHNINQIVVVYKNIGEQLMRDLLKCMQKKLKVTDLKRVMEDVTGKLPIELLDDHWFLSELSAIDKKYFWYLKRGVDIFLSSILLCIFLPFLPLIALLIKIDSGGPVFYSQMRVGKSGIPFKLWKLRTMVADADKDNVYWTTERDSRVTRIGRFMRKIRLDEIPQCINILKGDMSFIGPRPEAVTLVEMYTNEIPYYTERHIVTPGITGWAQINCPYGNSIEDTKEKLKHDFYYIKNRGIMLDTLIFLRTIRIVFTGKGAI